MEHNKFYNLFPYLEDKNKKNLLKIDDESISYISSKHVAKEITMIIKNHAKIIGLNKVIITDAFAGVGGDTLSFGMNFEQVNAIELNKTRYDYLRNNCAVYELKNVKSYNSDCMDYLYKLKHNIVFFDPPWGGKKYKLQKNIRIKINNIHQEDIINNLFKLKNGPEMIVLKLPKNYDITFFYNKVKNYTTYIHELNKMIILVVYKKNYL